MFSKIVSFFWSIIFGTNHVESRRRLHVCENCEHLQKKPSTDNNFFERAEYLFSGRLREKRYCGFKGDGSCGCGQWTLSELTRKTKFVKVRCPIGKWGELGAPTIHEQAKKDYLEKQFLDIKQAQASVPLPDAVDDSVVTQNMKPARLSTLERRKMAREAKEAEWPKISH